jgi:hypothetical protein
MLIWLLAGPRNRAPLGLKTTNAKAKVLQTPAADPVENGLNKDNQKSATARKPKPRVSHSEMTKLEIHGDQDVLAERDMEYMPPRVQSMLSNAKKFIPTYSHI